MGREKEDREQRRAVGKKREEEIVEKRRAEEERKKTDKGERENRRRRKEQEQEKPTSRCREDQGAWETHLNTLYNGSIGKNRRDDQRRLGYHIRKRDKNQRRM